MSPTTISPPSLKPGSTIAFLSPSARLNEVLPISHSRAASYFQTLGYKVKAIFNSTPTSSFHSETLQRVQELHDAFLDPEITAIITTIGGSHCNELLPHINYEIIKNNPKIFVGYSDITLLHHAFFTKAGLQTFYGPCALSEFAEFPTPDEFTTKHFFQVLGAAKPAGPVPRSVQFAPDLLPFFHNLKEEGTDIRKLEPSPAWKWLRPGKATGRLLGGCLPALFRLSGTPYWPSHKNSILFLETPMGERNEDPLPLRKTRAYLADLVNTGIFDEVCGLVVGRPYQHNEVMRTEFEKIVLDQVGVWEWPVLMNVDFGHTSPMLTLPFNAMVSLDSDGDEFSILEAAVV